MFIQNDDWEILGPDGEFYDFHGMCNKQDTTLRKLIIGEDEVWASDDHIFFVDGNPITTLELPDNSSLDGVDNQKIKTVKTNETKIATSFDIIECANPNHQYIINENVTTHNCDEFAFVAPNIQETFWTSISPTLSTGGSCIITSTPNGDSNLFAQLWRGAELNVNGFISTWVKWDEPPGRDEQFEKEETAKIGELKFRQEYRCEFLSSDALLIGSIILNNIKTRDDIEIDHSGFLWFEQPHPKQTLLIGVDPSTGTGSDISSVEIFDFPSMRQVGEFRSNTTSSVDMYILLKTTINGLTKIGATVYFSVENNGVGEGIIALYQNDENPPDGHFVSEEGRGRLGMTTTSKTKMKACMNLKELVTKGRITIHSRFLVNELKGFVRKMGTYAAQYGSTDDSVSATLIVVRLIEEISSYEDEAFEMLYGLGEASGDVEEYDETDEPPAMSFGASEYGRIHSRGSFLDPNDPNSFDPFGHLP